VSGPSYVAEISGDLAGRFAVTLDAEIFKAPLLGEGVDQAAAWAEILREVAEAAAGELLASSSQNCRINAFQMTEFGGTSTKAFQLSSLGCVWTISVHDELRCAAQECRPVEADLEEDKFGTAREKATQLSPGLGLLLDVELEATLRFGSREMPLGEILELGPGDVVELDRHVADPVDLVVGDKIVARGEVVLVNGNFGLRVTEVATPQRRLESIRCLF
jgi:flagellar motor switch protein FliN